MGPGPVDRMPGSPDRLVLEWCAQVTPICDRTARTRTGIQVAAVHFSRNARTCQ